MDLNIDASEIEKVRKDLERETLREVKPSHGLHNLRFGHGIVFEISPVGDTYAFAVFRPSFFDQDRPRLELVKELSRKVKYLKVSEPHVIEVDHNGVHPERHEGSYRTKLT